MKLLLTGLFLLVVGAVANDAIVGLGGMKVSDFKYQGDGYLLEGAKATTLGDRIRIEQARATVTQGDDVLVIVTPEVVFNRATQRGSGDGEVVITSSSGRLRMTGKGFDADFRRQRVRIRRNARMVLKENTAEMLEKAVGKTHAE